MTIINGKVISGESCDNSISKKFDQTKKESANEIKRITIDSSINVNVSACNTNDVIAHLHGTAIMDGDIKFSVSKFGDELRVCAKAEGTSSCGNISIIFEDTTIVTNSCSSGNILTLDVQIPIRTFEKIYAKSKNAKIDICRVSADNISVDNKNGKINICRASADNISVDNKNGKINILATFQTLNIECKNGNIKVDSEAHCDVMLNVASTNSSIDVSIENICNSNVFVSSKNGKIKNNPKLSGCYTASGYITSKNGNVKFH